ncbi:hypothetical protein DFO58_2175 [Arthrobacter sp. AG1021]|uniref:hypothetical protein n=1 Tax=Arthrobacter sp. AG1021 TaxID=2183908 RepID=UPI000EAFFAD1|nr:hypothetical protein [Arthrobacter sp. AG1021]RKS19673.1 hypothetical protein DFO58_2175 [Arthrobacter sp. AG1021]
MAKQTCKACTGTGKDFTVLKGGTADFLGCFTCDGTGTIHRTGPYRLTDGTWSDGIDRTHQVRAYGFNKANPTRWTVNRIGESWEAYQYDSERESSNGHFGTHAEAIRYADHHARTTKNGDA